MLVLTLSSDPLLKERIRCQLMKERQNCSFISDVLHAELTGFQAQGIYYARKFVDCDVNVAGWLLAV